MAETFLPKPNIENDAHEQIVSLIAWAEKKSCPFRTAATTLNSRDIKQVRFLEHLLKKFKQLKNIRIPCTYLISQFLSD